MEKRFSYAGWTAPSHYNLLTGLLPHTSPTEVYASEYYKKDLYKFKDRLGVDEAGFEAMIPHLWLPSYLKAKGYENNALVSLPVLNPATGKLEPNIDLLNPKSSSASRTTLRLRS